MRLLFSHLLQFRPLVSMELVHSGVLRQLPVLMVLIVTLRIIVDILIFISLLRKMLQQLVETTSTLYNINLLMVEAKLGGTPKIALVKTDQLGSPKK